MPKPYNIGFGPWLPDGADVAFGIPMQYSQTAVPLADCQNVYYSQGAYRSLPSFVPTTGAGSPALPAQCLGVFTALDVSGNAQIYAAAGSDLYLWTGVWSPVSSSAGAYPGSAHWSFTDFGGCILGVNGIHPLQDGNVGSGDFAPITAAPIGNVLGVINQSLMIGDIVSAANDSNAYPYRVMWSGIGDPTSWPIPLTDAAIAAQAGQQDLTQDFGRVMFIGGGPQLGVILQRNGITRATYQGGNVPFQWVPYERKRGLVARNAAIQVGFLTHFLADDGFHMTDGSQVVPTGTATNGSAMLDKWFWNNVNQEALSTISAGYDANMRCVLFAIPTGSNTLPDTLLILNPMSGQWTKAAIPTEMLWAHTDGTRHRVGLFNQSHAFGFLIGPAASGYCETYDLAFVDAQFRHIIEAQPHILCTDSPTMRIGTKERLDDALTYTSDQGRDSFTGRVPFAEVPGGMFIRARVTSSAATAINGATLYTEGAGSL